MDNIGGTVFSTTAIQSSQRFLTKRVYSRWK